MISRLFYLIIVGVLLFTVDGLGQNTWVKTFGGTGNDIGFSIISTSDDEILVSGYSNSTNGDFVGMNKGNNDIILIKLDSSGNMKWKKSFGGSLIDYGLSTISSIDGGFFFSGYSNSTNGDFVGMNKGNNDIILIKLDSSGNMKWKKSFGGSNDDRVYSFKSTIDTGVILIGVSSSIDGDFDTTKTGLIIFVMKIDYFGNVVWSKKLGGSGFDNGYSVETTPDGCYLISGGFSSKDGDFQGMNKGSTDIFLIKLDSYGNVIWKRTYGGTFVDEGRKVLTNKNGDIMIMGYSSSNDSDFLNKNKGSHDIFLMRLDSIGNIIWLKTFGGSSSDIGRSLVNINNDKLLVCGMTSSIDLDLDSTYKGMNDIFIFQLDRNGDLRWKKTLGGTDSDNVFFTCVNNSNNIILTGSTNSVDGDFNDKNRGLSDIFVMKLDSNGNLNNTSSINEFSEPTTTLSVHPNPFHNSTTISYKVNTPSNVRIELLNTLGQTIEVLREDYTDIGTYQLPLNISTLSSGMYSVRMRSGSMNEVVPVWVVR